MRKLWAAASVALACFSAHAQFSNSNGVITDATTGMKWLDLSHTYGLSFNNVSANLDSQFAGYRFATLDEVKQLFRDAYFWVDTPLYVDSDPIHLATNDLFFEAFTGVNNPQLGDRETVQGYVAGGGIHISGWPDGVNLQFASGVVSGYTTMGFTSTAWTDATAPTTDIGSATYGSWLVAIAPPVPEPATYALLLAGLVAMSIVWRKRSELATGG
jgi:hypothetical protein